MHAEHRSIAPERSMCAVATLLSRSGGAVGEDLRSGTHLNTEKTDFFWKRFMAGRKKKTPASPPTPLQHVTTLHLRYITEVVAHDGQMALV